MREMTDGSHDDPRLAAAYRRAHESYLAERDAIESLGTTFSGGGMPDRVKCLHVLIAHSLAKGPGREPASATRRWRCWPPNRRWPGSWTEDGGREHRRDERDRVAAIDCGTNSIRLLIADLGRRAAARCPSRDAHRAAGPGRRRHRAVRAGSDRADQGRADRLRRAVAPPRRYARCGWSRRRRPATPPTATSSSR